MFDLELVYIPINRCKYLQRMRILVVSLEHIFYGDK